MAAQLFQPLAVVGFDPHRGVQAESVDVGAQGLVHSGLAWHRATQSQNLLPGAWPEGDGLRGQQHAQRDRQRQHPSPHRHLRDDVAHQVGGGDSDGQGYGPASADAEALPVAALSAWGPSCRQSCRAGRRCTESLRLQNLSGPALDLAQYAQIGLPFPASMPLRAWRNTRQR
jgi:hypothetical protein